MGCFSGCLMSAASNQKLFCKLCSPFCCSFDEFVEEKMISPSYSSAILTPPPQCFFLKEFNVGKPEEIHSDFQTLLSEINSSNHACILKTANRIYGKKTYPFHKVSANILF